MNLDHILTSNQKFVETHHTQEMSVIPKKELVIVTCMDVRLMDFLEPALGLKRGDAHIIKNAGNTRLHEELIRSLAISVYAFGTKEIMIIGHNNCGMATIKTTDFADAMIDRGLDPETIAELDLENWIGNYEDEKENVIQVVRQIQKSPLIPGEIKVHGLLINIQNGKLEVLV